MDDSRKHHRRHPRGRGRTWPGALTLALTLLCAGAVRGEAYVSVHQAELARHQGSRVLPALVGTGGAPRVPLAKRAASGESAVTVFGFLPYWIDPAYYERMDLGLLTHVAAFAVEVDPDGILRDLHGWPWTALVDRAHAKGVRVILTATLFGNSDVLELLRSDLHRQTFFRNIRDAVIAGGADGVDIDFEGSGANGWPSQIDDFMAELTEYLHAEVPGSQVSFAGPAVDWAGRFDFPGLAAACDYIFIMGYAFSGSWSKVTGPTAPLGGGSRNLTTTITRDYGEVDRNAPEKLILGVPYYGCHWRTAGPEPSAEVTGFVRYPYFSATQRGARTYGSRWDTVSATPWYRYQDGDAWHQVWHEDGESLRRKYELALEHDLRGVGMWALGYEGDSSTPWDVLEETIGRRESVATWAAQAAGARETTFRLLANYPNPFNGRTTLEYELPRAGSFQLTLLDVLGRAVRRWPENSAPPGVHRMHWDGRDDAGREAASGVYLMRARYTPKVGRAILRTRRLVLVR